ALSFDAQSNTGGSSDPSLSLAVPANGVAIMCAITGNSGSSAAPIGIAQEDADLAQENGRSLCAHDNFVDADGALTVTADFSANSNARMSAVSWGVVGPVEVEAQFNILTDAD